MFERRRSAAYLEASAEGATELELLLIVYDALTAALHQAGQAAEENDVARRCALTNQILLLLGHLESWALRGDDAVLAEGLCTWYQYLRQQLLQLQGNRTGAAFQALATLVSEVRHTWKAKEDLMLAQRSMASPLPVQMRTGQTAGWSA